MDMIRTLPSNTEMYRACVSRDSEYEGVFILGVKTTGIFCRPTCPARKPRPENVEYFPNAREALAAGYRPCKRCRPLEPRGQAPEWLRPLLTAVESNPTRRWRDQDLRNLSMDPIRVRRWFQVHHGMTFHAYERTRRLGKALGRLQCGDDLTLAGYDHGYESTSGFRDAFESVFGTTPGRGKHAGCIVMTRLLSPLGPMVAAATEKGVCLLDFADRRMLETQIKRLRSRHGCEIIPGENEHLTRLEDELQMYFCHEITTFTVPLDLMGTDFQLSVWRALQMIPYGSTRSYDEQARSIGRPGAQRAVGKANGDNRIAIVIPCHRVVRSDGALCGYGGGLWRKKHLLELEQSVMQLRDRD